MTPMILGLGVPELLIILAVVLLLFGGTRLAGIGRSSGRAIREFKEETKGLTEQEKAAQDKAAQDKAAQDKAAGTGGTPGLDRPAGNAPAGNAGTGNAGAGTDPVVDAEIVDRNPDDLR